MEQDARFSPFYASTGICRDTRNIVPGCLFVCIQGENFDGNKFAHQALEQGAHHVIVDNPKYYHPSKSMTLVENTVSYLQALANYHRKKFDVPVIGITGSNGKTTTKELIYSVLSKKYKVLATEGNLNNHIGVPLTLLRLTEEHEIAIIEMGANRFKDIEELCAIAEPNFGIITNIGKAHLEGFGGFEGVLKTKRELYEAISMKHGTLVVNTDDEVLLNAITNGVSVYSYGTSNQYVQGELHKLTPFVEMSWTHDNYTSPALEMQMVGKYNFYNYLAAATFGCLFKVPNSDISDALKEYAPTNNRSQVQKSEHNTLIVDCYNANPTSMFSALESFRMMDHPNKLAILGDMRELGTESESEHRKILNFLEDNGISAYTVGAEFGKHSSPQVQQHFENVTDAKSHIEMHQIDRRLILLKGSRSIQLEKLLEVL